MRLNSILRPLVLLGALASAPNLAATEEEAPQNWLNLRAPVNTLGVGDTAGVTDGRAALDGARWDSPLATRLADETARLVFDLGEMKSIGCLWLQADNNDEYPVLQSADGQSFTPLWTAPAVSGEGLRLRQVNLAARTRYLIVTARGGDRMYSLSEFGAANTCPDGKASGFFTRAWLSGGLQWVQAKLVLAAALVVAWLLWPAGGGRGAQVAALAALVATLVAAAALVERHPLFAEESLLRALIAAVACALVLREGFGIPVDRLRQRIHLGILALLATLSLGCYYHFGTPQFWDEANARRTTWHPFDMRHYFPQAKYFGELRFDGLYVASLGAYLDNTPGAQLEMLGDVRLRDLKTSAIRYAPTYGPELAEVRARFTPERWHQFRGDMLYIQQTMGARDYLGSMQDHGGNATPAWILPAWLLFRSLPASETTLGLAGLIDPLLILLLLACVWRSFDARVALYTAILFGATDFYMFGSNLMGSTLRQDWLVALGFGACALKTQRPFLGGALLAYAGMVRAFPAMATFFLAAPVLWWAVDELRARRIPGLRAAWASQRESFTAAFGAAMLVVGTFGITSAVFGFQDSWVNWYEKISIHAADPSVNNIGMRNLMSFDPRHAAKNVLRSDHPEPWIEWQRLQRETYDARWPLTLFLTSLGLALTLFAVRGRPLYQVTLFGLLTIPFLFYPSNYYFHYIFLLPLALAPATGEPQGNRPFAFGVSVLCLLCIGQYFTLFEGWSDLRYTWQNVLLFAATIGIVVVAAIQREPE